MLDPEMWPDIACYFAQTLHETTIGRPLPKSHTAVFLFAYKEDALCDKNEIVDVTNLMNACYNMRVYDVIVNKTHVVVCAKREDRCRDSVARFWKTVDFVDYVVAAYINGKYGVPKDFVDETVMTNQHVQRLEPFEYLGVYEYNDDIKYLIMWLKTGTERKQTKYCSKHWLYFHSLIDRHLHVRDYFICAKLHPYFKFHYAVSFYD